MQRPQRKKIRGIGLAMSERLGRDRGIDAVADVARLNVTDVERAQQADGSHVRNGDVARSCDHARQLVSEEEPVANEPLATFVVEAWKPLGEPGDQPHFVVHHIETDETSETSAPQSAIDDVVRWMQERVTAAVSAGTIVSAERRQVAHSSASEQLAPPSSPPSARRGRLEITGLEVRHAEDHVIDESAISLLTDDPVMIEAGGALVLVGHVSLEGTEGTVICQMRCRLHRIESEEEVAFTWCGEIKVAPGTRSATIPSTPVSLPVGVYRGEFFAEDRLRHARRAFCGLPLLVVT
jgi:hypothetical protein